MHLQRRSLILRDVLLVATTIVLFGAMGNNATGSTLQDQAFLINALPAGGRDTGVLTAQVSTSAETRKTTIRNRPVNFVSDKPGETFYTSDFRDVYRLVW